MNSFISLFLRRTCQSFWFIPATLITTAFIASVVLTWIDHKLQLEAWEGSQWLLSTSPAGARSVLSTIAGSTITVAGVILSTTIVVLTLASQQYGPRLLRNFIEDRPSQFVIGSFTSCFIYSILILRSIRSGDFIFVPHLSVLLAVLAALVCICLMIYFIHHVSVEIQVQSIMARVHRDLRAKIDHLFPSHIGDSNEDEIDEHRDTGEAPREAVHSVDPGYLQAIRNDLLLEATARENVVVEIKQRPGEFIFEGDLIAEIDLKKNESISKDLIDEVRRSLVIGRFPTSEQDVRFPIQQLEEIAIRALSPGINDPHTALECVDYLASAMCTLARRSFPSEARYDDSGHLRVLAKSYDYRNLLDAAFKKIHHHGQLDPCIVCHLFEVLGKIAATIPCDAGRRTDVVSLAKRFLDDSESSLQSQQDKDEIREAYRACMKPILREIPNPI
ncbi:MAG TPA: hypothetical protein DCX06_10825 [Opitutae bacterium]|nr:hypothetical protein [Opitutae bacterium]